MASVKVEQNAAGDYAIGVEVEGAFIPFAQVSAARIAHQVERRQDLEEKAKGGDEEAQDERRGVAGKLDAGRHPFLDLVEE